MGILCLICAISICVMFFQERKPGVKRELPVYVDVLRNVERGLTVLRSVFEKCNRLASSGCIWFRIRDQSVAFAHGNELLGFLKRGNVLTSCNDC
jgi:hypothetical protein